MHYLTVAGKIGTAHWQQIGRSKALLDRKQGCVSKARSRHPTARRDKTTRQVSLDIPMLRSDEDAVPNLGFAPAKAGGGA